MILDPAIFVKKIKVIVMGDFYKNYKKDVFAGEECAITNPNLERARRNNDEKKWDYYRKTRFTSSMPYDSEAERRKALWELGRKLNPMLKKDEEGQ